MKQKNSRGFVLLACLMISSMMASLLLSALQSLLLYSKINAQRTEQHQLFYETEFQVTELIQSGLDPGHACFAHTKDMKQLLDALQNRKGCGLNKRRPEIIYQIQDLGVFPCQRLEKNKVKQSAQHWLWSFAVFNKGHLAFVLQMREIKPVAFMTCPETAYAVKQGIVSWRKLHAESFF